MNPWHTLPEGDTPELVKVKGGEYVDKRIYAALTSMLEAAQENGFEPNVLSGYRTYEQQQAVMEEKIAQFREQGYTKEEAKQLAEQWVAVPGTSEHQLGLAVDIEGNSYDIFPWLEQNSYRYGFIYRYPPDKTDITGISNEPWHFRYVGVQAATEMYEKGLCLEEYLETKK